MKTSNFDLLIELKEDLINRAFAIAFYSSALPVNLNGKLAVSKNLPAEMKCLGDVDFKIRIKEPPTVDAIAESQLLTIFNIEFVISMIHGLRYEFDIVASVSFTPNLLSNSEKLSIILNQGHIDKIVFDDKNKLPAKTTKALDEIIKAALNTNLLDKLKDFDISGFIKPLAIKNPLEGIDAVIIWNNGKTYFLKGENCISLDTSTKIADIEYPKKTTTYFPDIWSSGIDAAMVYPNGKAYFFKEEKYMRIDIASGHADPGYPAKIKDGWHNIWDDGLDAAVAWNNGKAYFFKGHQYIRYDIAKDEADEGYPKNITPNWPGIWSEDIDAVVLWNNGKAYFFKGDEYISYDVALDKADPGFPKKISYDWKNVWYEKFSIPFRPGGFKLLNQRVFAAGINLFDNPLGNINPVVNYTEQNDLWVGISERAMHQIFDYTWANIACHSKRKHWSETYEIVNSNALNYINGFTHLLTSIVPKLLTGGLLSSDVTLDYLKCDASATVSIEKPEFDLLPSNKLNITNLRANINLYLRVYAKVTISTTVDTSWWIPDELTPWEDDIKSSSTTTFNLIDVSLHFSEALKEVEAELICDLTKGIFGKITKLKVDIDLGVDLISDAFNWLINKLTELILPLIPPIQLLPPVLQKELNIKPIDLQIEKEIVKIKIKDYVTPEKLNIEITPGPITFDNDELTVAANFSLIEMPRKIFSLPLFVANCNTKRMEVHRTDCTFISEIDQAYRIGYYVLNDAINDGFDGCKYCLPEYHTK